MTEPDDDRLAALDAVPWRDAPRPARGFRRHRRARAWLALALAVGAVVTGTVLRDAPFRTLVLLNLLV
ncbi:DUF3040 domain-containing protein, partial [Streptomyces sp. NPDC001919]